jgi:hypothetical protein
MPRAHRVSYWLRYSLLTLPGERFLTPLGAMQVINIYGHSHELTGLGTVTRTSQHGHEWRRSQVAIQSRTEAIRTLVELGLEAVAQNVPQPPAGSGKPRSSAERMK